MAILIQLGYSYCTRLRSVYSEWMTPALPVRELAWIYKGVVVENTNGVSIKDVDQEITEMIWGCKESSDEHLFEALLDACRDSEEAVAWVVGCGDVSWGGIAKVVSELEDDSAYSVLFTVLKKHSEYVNHAMGVAYRLDDTKLALWLEDRGDIDWNQCLKCACCDGCVWMRDMAVAHGADSWNDAFLMACMGGNLGAAKWVYADGKCDNLDVRACVQHALNTGNPSLLDWVEFACGYLAIFLEEEDTA